MGKMLSKNNIHALTASAAAGKILGDFLKGLKEDTIAALQGVTTVYHRGVDANSTEVNDDSSDEATGVALANSLKVAVGEHLASTGQEGAHMNASAEAIATADATDLASAITLANELKADYNTHLTEATIHIANDAVNNVAAADATDQGTLDTLLNEIKADYNAHKETAMSSGYIEA